MLCIDARSSLLRFSSNIALQTTRTPSPFGLISELATHFPPQLQCTHNTHTQAHTKYIDKSHGDYDELIGDRTTPAHGQTLNTRGVLFSRWKI